MTSYRDFSERLKNPAFIHRHVFDLILRDDLNWVQFYDPFIRRNINNPSPYYYNYTFLQYACVLGRVRIFNHLMGIMRDMKNTVVPPTLLIDILRCTKISPNDIYYFTVQLLMEYNTQLLATPQQVYETLRAIIERQDDHTDLVGYVMKFKQANAEQRDLLHLAVGLNQYDIVRNLITCYGFNPNLIRDWDGGHVLSMVHTKRMGNLLFELGAKMIGSTPYLSRLIELLVDIPPQQENVAEQA